MQWCVCFRLTEHVLLILSNLGFTAHPSQFKNPCKIPTVRPRSLPSSPYSDPQNPRWQPILITSKPYSCARRPRTPPTTYAHTLLGIFKQHLLSHQDAGKIIATSQTKPRFITTDEQPSAPMALSSFLIRYRLWLSSVPFDTVMLDRC